MSPGGAPRDDVDEIAEHDRRRRSTGARCGRAVSRGTRRSARRCPGTASCRTPRHEAATIARDAARTDVRDEHDASRSSQRPPAERRLAACFFVLASGSGGGGGASSTSTARTRETSTAGATSTLLEHAVVARRPCVTLPTTRPGGKLAPRPLVTTSSPTCDLRARAAIWRSSHSIVHAYESARPSPVRMPRPPVRGITTSTDDAGSLISVDVGVVAVDLVDAADRAVAGDHRHAGLRPRARRDRSAAAARGTAATAAHRSRARRACRPASCA